MRWLDRNLPWVLLAAVVSTTALLVGVVGIGLLVVFLGLLTGTTLVAALGGTAAVLSVASVLVTVDVLLVVGLVVTVVRRASAPTSPRLARFFRAFERVFPATRDAGLSRWFEPSAVERERAIKRRYVEGELTELEFERELRDLLAETESADPTDDDVERRLARGDSRTRTDGPNTARDAPADARREVERE